ncbi:hypothetical protein CMU71_06170 [Elizabethkingia anophelis]|uniref:hypothetical protein n=1 Tax=Elizabethkingia anophelis TaxID=1117645 RepID=UPI0005315856|nr:hypothetical protein [Elizabethkingia anophelis]KGT08931.1 hypothetical protein NV63_11565 [Elizabethkingia anophelis]MDV3566482.1 hypothetical protein [Elizabethkingia anophelis]MDV3970811.1 hypothetical protein [Elizabethkingia anophelis]OPC41223.1 hypothetical protein BAY02_05200 [Elizabethkingia anophelis]QRI49889.1 hypothetical protein JQC76_17885 [Elizabethkingia anophelis]
MKSYEDIKAELINIADILKKYPENIQPLVFEILTKYFIGDVISNKTESKNTQIQINNPIKKDEAVKPKSNSQSITKGKETISLAKDLDLRPKGKASFKDIYAEKQPSYFNTVAIYYLKEVCQVDFVTPNHVYTCRSRTKAACSIYTKFKRYCQ